MFSTRQVPFTISEIIINSFFNKNISTEANELSDKARLQNTVLKIIACNGYSTMRKDRDKPLDLIQIHATAITGARSERRLLSRDPLQGIKGGRRVDRRNRVWLCTESRWR